MALTVLNLVDTNVLLLGVVVHELNPILVVPLVFDQGRVQFWQ